MGRLSEYSNEELGWMGMTTIEDKSMYKVSYYMNGNTVEFRWFKTLSEATNFCVYKVPTANVIEIKKYDEPENYHYNGS
jgi:hypothetical protein